MSLPEGTYAGISAVPLQEEHPDGTHPFSGRVEVLTGNGSGILIIDKGRVIAAQFRDQTREFKGKEVIAYLMRNAGDKDLNLRYVQHKYTLEQMAEAKKICRKEGLCMLEKDVVSQPPVKNGLDDALVHRLFNQQGVIAVSVFFEGFPVQSIGEGDFEQVAAMAEDFLRAGKKMAENLRMGVLDQIILESDQRKCIIAPYGDLYLCLLTNSDVNLGLIRLAIHNIQIELEGRG
ncbi:MAG: roadblock/LC7 domain-containing protein [Methanolinea sp.]|jgi:predicted regulator of Ras-like GTPase activity (Roadblock/LC7/MglB family)|nr:roadblock/LC7 domain-containing protein [Methanolinea sp.]